MEGGRRFSTSTALVLLALVLAASSTTTAAAATAQRRGADGGSSYKLITVQTYLGDRARLAVRADDSYIPGFANAKGKWFALQGTEDLLQPFRDRFGSDNVPSHGLIGVLGSLIDKKNAKS